MRADILLNNPQVTVQNESQTLCQWELGAYQALRSMALALQAEGVDQGCIARAAQTSLDTLTNECPEDNHTEQLDAAHALLGYTSVQETVQSLIDDALMDDDPDTAGELIRLVERSAAPMEIVEPQPHGQEFARPTPTQ